MAGLAGMKLGGCELLEEIGQGGMGVIYRARQLSLDRIVAVKILAEHLAHNPSFVERFQREARAIARINHTNILAVYDVGCQDNRHFMIMELVDGGSLVEVLEKGGVMDPWDAVGVILQAARGLECAAAASIIHRDVKPDNIMLTSRRVVKVSDFGLAKQLDGTMTETQAVMGTPAYMSPEQCDGRDLDSRTDIYSLGGTFYRCVTGRLPFEADTAMSMMYRHKHVPLTPPNQVVPTLPGVLSDIICRMMAKDRADRHQSMTEVIAALESAQRSPTLAPDLGKTMVAAPAPPPPPPEATSTGFMVPGSDSRIMAAAPSREKIEDTAARCKKAARDLVAQGKYAQAARELRRLLEVAPNDAEAKAALKALDQRASEKRLASTEIRTFISSGHYEEALARWKALPEDARDEQLIKQMAHLESVVVPALRLASQAETALAGGRLEDAAGLYQKALALDPSSERCKQGVKNLERTRGRIEFLIKEGYGHRQNHDYAQAVTVWEKVLAADPENAQARRLIIEALLAAAGEAAAAEDFEKAAAHYDALLKRDPKNDEARRALAEAVAKRDQVAELRKAAQMAKAKGDLAASAKAWRELTQIVPKNRVARDGLASARKSLSVKRARRMGLVLALLAVVGATLGVWQNWRSLGRAQAALESGDYTQARIAASRVWLPGLGGRAGEITRRADYQEQKLKSTEAARESRWAEAVESGRKALELYSGEDPAMRKVLENNLAKYECYAGREQARAAVKKQQWRQAATQYRAAVNWAEKGELVEARELDRHATFCSRMQNSLDAARERRWAEAAREVNRALETWNEAEFGQRRPFDASAELYEKTEVAAADDRRENWAAAIAKYQTAIAVAAQAGLDSKPIEDDAKFCQLMKDGIELRATDAEKAKGLFKQAAALRPKDERAQAALSGR